MTYFRNLPWAKSAASNSSLVRSSVSLNLISNLLFYIDVETKTLMSFWRSKHDLYKYFLEHKQIVIPPKAYVKVCKCLKLLVHHLSGLVFLRQLVCGEK